MKELCFKYWLVITLCAFSVLKLVLISSSNVIEINFPHDDFWYINTASHWIWEGEYNNMSFIHLQSYAIWLKLISLFGIPVRIAIELAWLFGCGYLSYAFYQLKIKNGLIILCFLFLIFHPYSFVFFERVLPETLLTVMTVFVIAAGIQIWNLQDAKHILQRRIAFIVYIFGFAIAFHLRKEGIVLLVPLFILTCISIFNRKLWWEGKLKEKMAIVLIILPIISTVILGCILASANYTKWGMWTRYELAAPGYKKVISALNHIDTGRTPHRMTVTWEMLEIASRESPTFKELQPFMRGKSMKMWYSISMNSTGMTEGISNGWFYWAIRDVAAEAGWHKSASYADKKYMKAANEIEAAFFDGRLKKRSLSFSSFIDPDYSKWLSELPISILNISKLVISPTQVYLHIPNENASSYQRKIYNKIAGNHQDQNKANVIGVDGWVVVPEGTQVGLGTNKKVFKWITLTPPERSDVPGAYAFSISGIGKELPSELTIRDKNGKSGKIKLNEFKHQGILNTDGDLQVKVGVDALHYFKKTHYDNWMPNLLVIYQWISYFFAFSTLVAFSLIFFSQGVAIELLVIMFVSLIIISTRVVVFSLLDASSWNGLQARYLFPVIPAFACMGVIAITLIIKKLYNNRSV